MIRLVVVILAAFVGLSARAADMTLHDWHGSPMIAISGQIVQGDDEQFKRLVSTLKGQVLISLKSDGGLLMPALQIGKLIRSKKYSTFVASQTSCLSACGFIFLGAKNRMMDPTARIGFHGAYVVEDGKAAATSVGNALVGAYLKELGFSDEVIVFATSARPTQMLLLTQENARQLSIQIRVTGTESQPSNQVAKLNNTTGLLTNIPIPKAAPRQPLSIPNWIAVSSERAYLILSDEPSLRETGSVSWRIGEEDNLALSVTFPVSGFEMRLWLKPSGIEVLVNQPNAVKKVARFGVVEVRESDFQQGMPLAAKEKLSNEILMLDLATDPASTAANVLALEKASWIDIPLWFDDGSSARVQLRKGISGGMVLDAALRGW